MRYEPFQIWFPKELAADLSRGDVVEDDVKALMISPSRDAKSYRSITKRLTICSKQLTKSIEPLITSVTVSSHRRCLVVLQTMRNSNCVSIRGQ
jgi:hypothetical protein